MCKERNLFEKPVAIDRLSQDPLEGYREKDKVVDTLIGLIARDDSDAGVAGDITEEDYASETE